MLRYLMAFLIPASLASGSLPPDWGLPAARPAAIRWSQAGLCSYVHPALQGRRTAFGGRWDERQMAAAHRTARAGAWLVVRRVDNGREVRVRCRDRGPYAARAGDRGVPRIVDLSRAAATKLGIRRTGIVAVEVREL